MQRPTAPCSRSILSGLTIALVTTAPLTSAYAGPYEDMVSLVDIRADQVSAYALRVHEDIEMAIELGIFYPGIRPPKIYESVLLSSVSPTGDPVTMINLQSEGLHEVPWAELESGVVVSTLGVLGIERGNAVGVLFQGPEQATLIDPFTGMEWAPVSGGSWWDPTEGWFPPMTTMGTSVMAIGVDDHWTIDDQRISVEALLDIGQVLGLLDQGAPDPAAALFDELRVQSELAFEAAIGEGAYDVAGMASGQRDGDATLTLAAAELLDGLDPEALAFGADLGVAFVGDLSAGAQGLIPAGFYRISLGSEDGETLLATWHALDSDMPVYVGEARVDAEPEPGLGGVTPVVAFEDGGYTVGASWSVGGETRVTVSVPLDTGTFGTL